MSTCWPAMSLACTALPADHLTAEDTYRPESSGLREQGTLSLSVRHSGTCKGFDIKTVAKCNPEMSKL